jgi:hypothetical protein
MAFKEILKWRRGSNQLTIRRFVRDNELWLIVKYRGEFMSMFLSDEMVRQLRTCLNEEYSEKVETV